MHSIVTSMGRHKREFKEADIILNRRLSLSMQPTVAAAQQQGHIDSRSNDAQQTHVSGERQAGSQVPRTGYCVPGNT